MKNQPGTYDVITTENLVAILVFFFAGLWFYLPGRYVLYANEDIELFVKSPSYLWSFLDRPGGMLEYAGSFLTQFYRFPLAGALVLGLISGACFLSANRLFNRVSGKKGAIWGGVVAALLLMGMHNYYPHQLSHSLGILLGTAMAAGIPAKRSRRRWYLALGVLLVYLLGGGFAWFFCALALIVILSAREKPDILSVLLSLVYPCILAVMASLIYLYPWRDLISIQLPVGPSYGFSPWPYIFLAWILLMSLLLRITKGQKKLPHRWKLGVEVAICLASAILIMHFSHHRKNAEFFSIEKMAIEEEWDRLLEYTELHPSTNLFGSFYTNLALANRDLLCEELFRYPQVFGRRGLCFGWEEKEEILRRGSDFFWTIHYVNEAHHWAFESLIIEGPTRRNLRRLIQTELVRGNFRVAEKYIDQLDRSLFQKKLADQYATLLANPDRMKEDPELGPRMNCEMTSDFFAEGADLEKNLRSVLDNHPYERPAIDYLMALYLLEKNVDAIPPLLPNYLESHGGKLPSLLEESLLVYQITHREEAPSDLKVSPATLQRFDEYTKVLRQYRNPEDAARMLYPIYRHTFWFHLNFNSLTNR